MSERRALPWLAAVLLSVPFAAEAATPVPPQLPVSSFATHSQMSMPRLSPDGKYLALRIDDRSGDQHALAVYRVEDMQRPASMLRMPKYELPIQISWVSPTRLVVAKGKQMGSVDKPYATGEIIATDFDGKNQDYLFGFDNVGKRAATRGRDRAFGSIDGLPDPANGHVYVGSEDWGGNDRSELYDIEAVKNTRRLIGDIGVGGMNFMVGPDGVVRFAYGTNEDFQYVAYHVTAAPGASLVPTR